MPEIATIGAYGWSAETFFDALVCEQVGSFCDVRARRGVRGAEYSFANSKRLQGRLQELGIAYHHRPDLAPTDAVRKAQYALDAKAGVGKLNRSELSPEFISAYRAECLSGFDAEAFLDEVGGHGRICLFCVERDPEACHRSVLAERLASEGAMVTHLVP